MTLDCHTNVVSSSHFADPPKIVSKTVIKPTVNGNEFLVFAGFILAQNIFLEKHSLQTESVTLYADDIPLLLIQVSGPFQKLNLLLPQLLLPKIL